MSELPKIWVEYPSANPQGKPVVAERVKDVDDQLALGVVRVMHEAYAAQFRSSQIPPYAISETIDPYDIDSVAERRDIMAKRIQSGKNDYWVVRSADPTKLDGMIRIAPTPPERLYIGDIVVAPPWRRGIGTRLLHAALTQSGCDQTSAVELDAFEGSSVNGWYQKLGFQPQSDDRQYYLFGGGYTAPLRAYKVKHDVLVQKLEQRTPALRQARVRYLPEN